MKALIQLEQRLQTMHEILNGALHDANHDQSDDAAQAIEECIQILEELGVMAQPTPTNREEDFDDLPF